MNAWIVPVVVLLSSVALLGLLTFDIRMLSGCGWRVAALKASLLLGVLVWVIGEALGALRALEVGYVLASWVLVGLVAIGVGIKLKAWARRVEVPLPVTQTGMGAASSLAKGALGLLVAVAAALALVALVAAPNTADSMIYHLSRVMHWQQNRSMDFYATAIQRQLAFTPGAEMGVLQFQILTGDDRLDNLVQYFAFIGVLCAVTLIVRSLGGGESVQLFAAMACSSLPMAILQATSTQNDMVVAFWSTTFLALLLSAPPSSGLSDSLWLGAALGLAALTKVTALVFLAPFGIWHAVVLVRSFRWRAWRPFISTLGMAVLLVAPHSLRNFELYDNPLGIAPGPELAGYTNEVLGLPTLFSNALRTTSAQLAIPNEGVNRGIQVAVRAMHAWLGLDPDDPQTTWRRTQYDVVFSMYENRAANPLHFVLIIVGLASLLRSRTPATLAFGLCVLAAFLLFSLAIKWQPWNSRLLLTVLIWGLIVVALQMANWLAGQRILFLGFPLVVLALPYLAANPSRPLLGDKSIFVVDRLQQYFTGASEDYGTYSEAARLVLEADCHDVGLMTSPEGREYLLWAVARKSDPGIRIEHVEVRNPSRRYAGEVSPCALVITRPINAVSLQFNGRLYRNRISTERYNLFLLEEVQP